MAPALAAERRPRFPSAAERAGPAPRGAPAARLGSLPAFPSLAAPLLPFLSLSFLCLSFLSFPSPSLPAPLLPRLLPCFPPRSAPSFPFPQRSAPLSPPGSVRPAPLRPSLPRRSPGPGSPPAGLEPRRAPGVALQQIRPNSSLDGAGSELGWCVASLAHGGGGMRGALGSLPTRTRQGFHGIEHKFWILVHPQGQSRREEAAGGALRTLPRDCCLEQRTLHTQGKQQVQTTGHSRAGLGWDFGEEFFPPREVRPWQTRAAHLKDLMSHVTPVGAAACSHHPKHPADKGSFSLYGLSLLFDPKHEIFGCLMSSSKAKFLE